MPGFTLGGGNARGSALPPPARSYLNKLPNLREYGAQGDGVTDDTSAINAAIAAVIKEGTAGLSGGSIFVPTGQFMHEGELNLKELTNIHFVGSGASVGGGGIGVGLPVGASVFVYTGKGSRAWDFRSSVGCDVSSIQCFAWGSGFTGPIWDLSGTEAKPSALGHFYNARAEATRVGGKSAEEILACKGALLDFSNIHTFDACTFSSCKEGVEGISTIGHSAVGHRFLGCFFAGNQSIHCANPQETWLFQSCVAESLFNRKGEILNRPAFIAFNKVYQAHAITVLACWSGSNVIASREGVNIEARGDNWVIEGNSLNTGEVGVYFPEGPVRSTVTGNRFWKVKNGLTITGKTVDSAIAWNTGEEINVLVVDTINERKGSIVQLAAEEALKVS